jgi:hypothetical protein
MLINMSTILIVLVSSKLLMQNTGHLVGFSNKTDPRPDIQIGTRVARRKRGCHYVPATELTGFVSHRAFVCCPQNLVRRTTPKSIEELKSLLLVTWGLIPQATVDKWCEAFKACLELWLARGEGFILNGLWQISERGAMKTFLEDARTLLGLKPNIGS